MREDKIKMKMVDQNVKELMEVNSFSGAVLFKRKEIVLQVCHGYANRSDERPNNMDTRFGIASGCKLFTAIAICQLVEKGKLTFETKLQDCLDFDFPHFDPNITVHHLLTHTAGIPDYFDEEVMDDFEEIWITQPMYLMRNLQDFLPLFQHLAMKQAVGESFHYNNAGYILLGLIIEAVSEMSFENYITEFVLKKANMLDSGYFELDALPNNTAIGYIDLENGTWKTNSYSVPIKGGADGGAFTTVKDMSRLWDALMSNQLLNESLTKQLLTPYINTDEDYDRFYGYGIWIDQVENEISKYHVMGYDPGVSFHSAYYPATSRISVVCCNQSSGAFDIFKMLEQRLLDQR